MLGLEFLPALPWLRLNKSQSSHNDRQEQVFDWTWNCLSQTSCPREKWKQCKCSSIKKNIFFLLKKFSFHLLIYIACYNETKHNINKLEITCQTQTKLPITVFQIIWPTLEIWYNLLKFTSNSSNVYTRYENISSKCFRVINNKKSLKTKSTLMLLRFANLNK